MGRQSSRGSDTDSTARTPVPGKYLRHGRDVMTGGRSESACLADLAKFVRRKNLADRPIARVIRKPALPGHFGEFVAAQVFDIKLHEDAAHPGSDGVLRYEKLNGTSVNIKFTTKHDGFLNMNEEGEIWPDYYLVMTGPKENPEPAHGKDRPWVIESVFMFDTVTLVCELWTRNPRKKIGVATYVPVDLWAEAMIYPDGESPLLPVTDAQRDLLALFSAARIGCNDGCLPIRR